ncbi:DUF3267 domain-containing protein [Sphingobacterium sp. HJSM2_6]|uniref:DUF3267 domain-containing protein n=1 Tax=Sphingobacterium sp. HJSM2_6 TaxID=3366264 RepID=UPI003BE462A8
MNIANFNKKKLTIDLVKANKWGLIILIPISILYFVPFFIIWSDQFGNAEILNNIQQFLKQYGILAGFIPLIVLVLGIVVHELIHGITWAIFAKQGFKSIKYGILKKMLTPYCHCKEPLRLKHYIIGAIMPAVILGFLPAIIALSIGSFSLLLFAAFFTMAAIGDFMIIQLIKNENGQSWVLDHPSEAGCYILEEL